MKRLLLAGVALAALTVSAQSADLTPPAYPVIPLKALPTLTCTPAVCSGFYVGFNIDGIGTSLNVIGAGVNNSLFAAGFGLGGQAGYQLWNGTYFFAAEVSADYMTTPASAGVASTGYWRSTELVKAGAALATLFGPSPTPVVPSPSQGPPLPQALLAAVTSPYVILGTGQKSHSNALVSGAGVQAALAAGWNLSLEYQNWQYSAADVSPTVSQATENVVAIKLNRMF